jgi:hypothetical protein
MAGAITDREISTFVDEQPSPVAGRSARHRRPGAQHGSPNQIAGAVADRPTNAVVVPGAAVAITGVNVAAGVRTP